MKRVVSVVVLLVAVCALVGFDFNQTRETHSAFEARLREAVYQKQKVDVTLFATPLRVFGVAKSLNGNLLELTTEQSYTHPTTSSYVDISQIVILSVEQNR